MAGNGHRGRRLRLSTPFRHCPLQRVGATFRDRGVVPNWTAYRKAQVITRYKPWMHLHMLRTLRAVPVQTTWRKYRIDRDWSKAPKGQAGPRGLRGCIWVCKNLQPGVPVEGFGPKKRHQAAWTYGRFLKKKLVRRPGSEQRANS